MNKELFLKTLSFLTAIGLAISGWFLKETYFEMKQMQNDIVELKISNNASVNNQDFMRTKDSIDARLLASDRRVTVLEESQRTIKEFLVEIRSDLKEIKELQFSRN